MPLVLAVDLPVAVAVDALAVAVDALAAAVVEGRVVRASPIKMVAMAAVL